MKAEHKSVRKLLKQKDKLRIAEYVVYREIQGDTGPIRQVLLPTALKHNVLESLHNHAGHRGVERTSANYATRYRAIL